MATLLDISEDLLALSDLIAECDGELSPEVESALDQWFGEIGEARDDKLDNYAALIRDCSLRAAARKEEQERLSRRVKADEALVVRLKERLKLFLEVQGLKRVETRRYSIAIAQNGGLLPLEVNEELLPAKFIYTVPKVNTAALRQELESGAHVPGAQLLPRGSHIRIS